ncbi:PREDICTED: glucose dehydrogenase [FAD, quinone]-like [Rhagoletis zephyria]|uniref:glucose dehydrogenase [FAD, quinone]-like n=1 Tax=Rhagoletis zephyria TaxID=28612 RepID=UPI00081184F5|nr:PREDICTED: glucose dehydrogenase [FAD, quinone]-like [Rhagoletis zephyria]
MIYELTVKNGIRSGTGNAYIDPNPYPNNLHIMGNSLVTRILFSNAMGGGNPTATGVEFRRNGVTNTVRASREVIVSAGCIASPQLLLLSGIGPRDHLQSFGIPVVADLPVGNNFQDHVFIHHYYEVKNTSLINEAIGPTVQQFYSFYVQNTGRLTELPNSITFFSTSGNDDPNWPNAVIDTNTYNVAQNESTILAGYGPQYQSQWADFWRPYLGKQYLLITSAVYRTYSRGTIRLASTDPTAAPLIDPQYLSDQRDMEALVNMTKMLFYMTMTGDFPNYATIFPRPIPGCSFCADVPLWKCDSYVRCIIRQVADSALHPGGACRMGSADRTDTVVDPQLRVRGINQLRVIDSSVIPELANANTHAASVMIGEKGADLLRQMAN